LLVQGEMALASKIIPTVYVCVFIAFVVLTFNKFVPPTLRRDPSNKLTPPLRETEGITLGKLQKGATADS
jgi:hypothetical protein